MQINYKDKKILIELSRKEDLVNLNDFRYPILNERLNNGYLFLISSNQFGISMSTANLTIVDNIKDLNKYEFSNPYIKEFWLKEPTLVLEFSGKLIPSLNNQKFEIKDKEFEYDSLELLFT